MEMVEDPIGETMAKSRGGRSSDLPLDVAALMADEGAGIRSDAATASTSGGTSPPPSPLLPAPNRLDQ